MGVGTRCPFCGELGGVRHNRKQINKLETYNTYVCKVASFKKTWTTREVIIREGAKRLTKPSKSRQNSSKRSRHSPANVDGMPNQSVRPATDSETEFVRLAKKKSIGAYLLSLHTSVQASSKETDK